MDSNAVPHGASLHDLEAGIQDGLRNNACLIYWHYHSRSLMFFTKEDQKLYKKELKRIRDNVNERRIRQVKAGDNFMFQSKTLYTLLAEIDHICPAYYLLMRRGDGDDFYSLPYFFTSEKCRDGALEWIHNNTKNFDATQHSGKQSTNTDGGGK